MVQHDEWRDGSISRLVHDAGDPPRMIGGMLLAVDIGNTNVTVGRFRAGALLGTRRAGTNRRATPDDLEGLLEGLLALDGLSMSDIDAISLASVVPSLSTALEVVATRRDLPLLVASAGSVPIAIRVERPDEVGADRLVNVLAAIRLYGAPAVVMDLGTATTLECASADGAYVGGAIAPGFELGLEALAARTAKLPRIEMRSPDRAIGRTTVQAIQSGSILGYQALAAGLLEQVRAELAESSEVRPFEVRAILTGGLSSASWARAIRGIDVIDPDLTLKGLAILHAEVGGGEPLELGLT
jgi:type III pantothenate kinase